MMKEITVKTKQDKHGQTKVGSLTFEQIMQTWRVRTVLMDRWMGVGGNGCDWVGMDVIGCDWMDGCDLMGGCDGCGLMDECDGFDVMDVV